jgi:histidinol dehydrogenase
VKLIFGKKSTLEYLNKIRTNNYLNIKTSGNGYFEKEYNHEDYAKKIIEYTKLKGDKFLFELSSKLDDKQFGKVEISKEELSKSIDQISKDERKIIEDTILRIEEFQKNTLYKNWFDEKLGYGEYIRPINSVGCYIPSGSAPLISTILMTVIPAKIAGVKKIIVCSPTKGSDLPNKFLLASAYLSGVDKFYTYGGPQAISSMAYGTEFVDKVDMICGPGNIFVMSAKKLVYGDVGLDGIFGPTETLIIADSSSNKEYVIGDLMAQAEHDKLALPMMITNDVKFAKEINTLYKNKMKNLSRRNIIEESMNNGFISVLESNDEIIEVSNEIASEHISIASENLVYLSESITSAGSIFLGETSSEVLADYVAGPSHVMPTNGSAKYSSSVSSRTFLKSIPVLAIDKKRFLEISEDAEKLASLESLDAHKQALKIRREQFLME